MFWRLHVTLFFVLLLSSSAFAQDATVVGTVVDESNSLLPGVTVTATDVTTGRQFTAVTMDRGEYRLAGLPPSTYRIQAELQGFATVVLPAVELLVGQNATIPLTLKIATVAENVTVTAEAPLVDTRAARISSNVDRRQMEDLPIQGRNWLELTGLAKGITANSISRVDPGVQNYSGYQLNLDGHEITQGVYAPFGQPGLSRDAIAEYQVVTNLFDVTMGRSSQIQIQAITRSGTNNLDGSVYGYFRDDSLNTQDHFANRVLPYSNQQTGGTFGGPIVRDRTHFFGAYEYEREPNTVIVVPSPLEGQRLSFPTTNNSHSVLGRVDHQLGEKDRLLVRSSYSRRTELNISPGNYPTQGSDRLFLSHFTSGNWSRVVSSSTLQEVKVGYRHFHWLFYPMEGVAVTPTYQFPGLTIGPPWNYQEGEKLGEDRLTMRYDLTWHKGGHDLKIGGEWLRGSDTGWWMARPHGHFFFSAIPADFARRFPIDAWNDPSRWDFSGLDPLVLRVDQYYARRGGGNEDHGDWSFDIPRPTFAAWIGDTWAANDRLTLNLGVRYDVAPRDLDPPLVRENDILIDNGRSVENVGFRNGIRDLNNVAPRVGFTWNATRDNRLIVRGGTGLFYTVTGSAHMIDMQLWNGQRVIVNSYPNDGRPGFIQDPSRGVTADDVLSGRVPLAPQNVTVVSEQMRMPYTWQSILGFQKQLTDVMAFDADMTYWRGYNEESQRDPNLFYDPATGYNKNPARFGRPNPSYGPIFYDESLGHSDYLALATSFTRRYQRNFQLGMTYTAMFFKNDTNRRYGGYGPKQLNPFDIETDWGRAGDFQRHTLRASGIWNLPHQITLAGSYSFGSGNPLQLSSGVDPTGVGANRLRSDMSLTPRNSFEGDRRQTLDVRVSKELRIAGDVRIQGIAELFNLFNYKSFGYNTLETSRLFGATNRALSGPRSGQLAFRVLF
jgi:hypothetical protein